MEGILYKWTNYLSGWQPRWFVLDGGILSYYDSPEDAFKGCKGSIKMTVCEIQVHTTNNLRLDLIVPGEQYFYLKAMSTADRQRWLVALGSAKACLTDSRAKREKELGENIEILKTKMSALRLYCDLLLQQVTTIQDRAPVGLSDSQEKINMGALVKSTCSTFLKTLEECLQIANATFNSELLHRTPPGSPHMTVVKPNKVRHHIVSNHRCSATERKAEVNSKCENGTARVGLNRQEQPAIKAEKLTDLENKNQRDAAETENAVNVLKVPDAGVGKVDVNSEESPAEGCGASEKPQSNLASVEEQNETQEGALPPTEEDEVKTFFNTMSNRFSDIQLEEDNGIPTEPFLESCYAIVPVLDKLGSTVFAPVKIDFVGNIKKINQKYVTDPEKFTTLQKIVLYEVDTNVAQVRNSATEALLWLKSTRGLKFLKGFLTEVKNGEKNIQTALKKLDNAYGKTLRQYHGWVVRGVFALALRAAPTYEAFVSALVVNEGDEQKEAFYSGMQRDLNIYLPAMENLLDLLDALYEEYGLESDEVV
uniref:Pleckstrin homology domain-containing family A member 8 n=1 Tax=Latimeria chalumnae TaxID=7897 RepID=H3AEC6_LATCH